MSNWDDAIFCFESDSPPMKPRPTILHFCLNCGSDHRIRGRRYRVAGASEIGLLLDKAHSIECPICRFPVFSSSQYTLLAHGSIQRQ
jgi:hypothetical protein